MISAWWSEAQYCAASRLSPKAGHLVQVSRVHAHSFTWATTPKFSGYRETNPIFFAANRTKFGPVTGVESALSINWANWSRSIASTKRSSISLFSVLSERCPDSTVPTT